MPIVRIEHAVPDYEAWKQAFDGDPAGRQTSGVRRYQVMQASDDPNYVMVDLDFDATDDADAFLVSLRRIWERVQGTLVSSPRARIVELVETKEY
jgi:hypothetical protein